MLDAVPPVPEPSTAEIEQVWSRVTAAIEDDRIRHDRRPRASSAIVPNKTVVWERSRTTGTLGTIATVARPGCDCTVRQALASDPDVRALVDGPEPAEKSAR